MRQFATFTLAGASRKKTLVGIEVLLVREINRLLDITPVPHCPAYVRGLVNLRGHVATIMDLARLLRLPSNTDAANAHQVILKTTGELAAIRSEHGRDDLATSDDTVGFIIDAVGDVVEVPDDRIEPVPAGHEGPDAEFLRGVVLLDKQLLSLLDVQRVLARGNGQNEDLKRSA